MYMCVYICIYIYIYIHIHIHVLVYYCVVLVLPGNKHPHHLSSCLSVEAKVRNGNMFIVQC